jgi:hypothetical protein
MTFMFALLFILWHNVGAYDVILSAGIGGYNESELVRQYNSYSAYAEINVITGSSILAYYLDENGDLATYKTGDKNWSGEAFQQSIGKDLGLKTFPCLYCDETINLCSPLSPRLEKLYAHQDDFIKKSIVRALEYGWDGYYVDIESGHQLNQTKLTDFIVEWGRQLANNQLKLNVWIGSTTKYDNQRLFNSQIGLGLTHMDTYDCSYDEFINKGQELMISVGNSTTYGFGLLTNYPKTDVDLNRGFDSNLTLSISWSTRIKATLSLWASHISPLWFESLQLHVTKQATEPWA